MNLGRLRMMVDGLRRMGVGGNSMELKKDSSSARGQDLIPGPSPKKGEG